MSPMNEIFANLRQTISSLIIRPKIRKERSYIAGIFTRQVYDFVAEMPNIAMITPPNPKGFPIEAFEFRCGTHKFQIHLRSLNGMAGVDGDMEYDTGVDFLTALSGWRIPDATIDQLNEWNTRRRGSYAVKVDEFVELTNNRNLFMMKGCERRIIDDAVHQIIVDSEDFVEFMTSRH
jgi:hypothetical protein